MIIGNDKIIFSKDKSQIVNYNNPRFHCFSHEIYFSEDGQYQVTEHWHEDIEYLYVKEGTFRCSVNGDNIILNEGEGIYVNSKRIHSNGTIRGQKCVLYCVIINPSYMCASRYIEDTYVEPVIGPKSVDYIMLRRGDWTEEILDLICGIFENPTTRPMELSVIEVCFRVLGILHENLKPDMSASANTSIYEETFKTMVTYIDENFQDKISLDEIAGAGNIGKTLCTKIFKKYASKTPGDYLIHYRITRSMEWLADPKRSITDIAFSAGFNGASHYTETFRKMIGCTPNQFRKNLNIA